MRRIAALLPALALALLAAVTVPADAQPPRGGQRGGAVHDELSPRVQGSTGLYITGPFIRGRGAAGLIRTLRAAHMDTAVIDFKDAQGRVHHDSSIPELQDQETGMLGDTAQLIRDLHAANIHTIARIVCFNDPVLPDRFPDRAILDLRAHRRGRTRTWTSWGTGSPWLDPWDPQNHDLVIALSREAEALGFDEIQLDYIRFPVDDGIPFAHYPDERTDVRRRDLLHGLLARIDEAVSIPLGVDVFGIQAYWAGDESGLGQDLELWTDHVDVFTPMLYLNAMTEWEVGTPNRAQRLVQIGIQRMRERMGPTPVIRPFLQAFEQGSEDWGPRFIANQIRGARQGGADGFLFWHPGSNYGTVMRAMQGPAHSLAPFPIPEERTRARSALGG